ncbi:hypothetical protein GGE12_001093 [Rhizobium mongolense]|uniref:Uncharacterized protein n=1 Tax=Rhizobium mongolense TaxID=57676 RepID=A0A7W6RJ23_9HYPH|nr:hypothetical protein [Rhizobium mongolense]
MPTAKSLMPDHLRDPGDAASGQFLQAAATAWFWVLAANRLSGLNWPKFASVSETFFVTEDGCNNIQSIPMKKDIVIFR